MSDRPASISRRQCNSFAVLETHQSIRICEFNSELIHPKNICKIYKILLACNRYHVLYVSTFDEDLLKHISHELADDDHR